MFRFIVIAMVLCTQLACTATTLAPYEATYTTKLRGIKITGTQKLEETGENTFKVSWRARALWMKLNEWSEFELVEGKYIRPISYHYTRSSLGSDRPIHILFDWDNMQVKGSKGKQEYEFPLQEGTLDKLSYQVQMQLDLMRNPRQDQLSYAVANYNRIKPYEFIYAKTEKIDTRLGPVNARLYTRQSKDRFTEVWLSPKQDFLPLMIRQTDEDHKSTLKIKSWQSERKPATQALADASGAMESGDSEALDNLDSEYEPLEEDDF